MSYASYINLLCVISSGIATWVTLTSPAPVPKKSELSSGANRKWMSATYISKSFPTVVSCFESLVILSYAFNIPTLRTIAMVPISTPPQGPIMSTRIPQFYIGSFLVAFAAFIRYRCYSEMGRHFTFQVALLKNHTLVTTGPYSVVRHPGYSAMYFYTLGVVLMWSSPGGWVAESWFMETIIGKVIMVLWFMWWIQVVVMLTLRVGKEDEILKNNFESEWIEWQAAVPWRLFPGLY